MTALVGRAQPRAATTAPVPTPLPVPVPVTDERPEALLRLTGVEVRRGGRAVVTGVDLAVDAGEVLGLIGRNGAGKTTVLRALLGLTPVARGTVWRRDPHSVGVAFDTVSFPPSWSAREGLRCLGGYLGLGPAAVARAESVLDRVGLPAVARDRRLSALSHGMRQLVSLAAALLGDPRLVVLDEPHNGLDPLAVHALGRVVRGLADEGTGVLLSSHLIDEMDRVCDRVAVLHEGRIVLESPVAELTHCRGWHIEAGEPGALVDLLARLGHRATRDGEGALVAITTAPEAATLAAALLAAGAPVSVLRPHHRSLVDVVHTALGSGAGA